jgi:hypothetical protein
MEGVVKIENVGSHNHGHPHSNDSYSSNHYLEDSGSMNGESVVAYESNGAMGESIDAGLQPASNDGESNESDPNGSEADLQFQQRYLTHEFIPS